MEIILQFTMPYKDVANCQVFH